MTSIESKEEQDFISTHISERPAWIGLSRPNGGELHWTDGTPINWINWCPSISPDNLDQRDYVFLGHYVSNGIRGRCWSVRDNDRIRFKAICKLPRQSSVAANGGNGATGRIEPID